MKMHTDLRLPGVYFLAPPDQPGMDLPPLDVAAFVGYAARGPLDYPVAIEDTASYAAIFGGDLALAHREAGGIVWANLRSAVDLFFANGGRRCYVVRVAGEEPTHTKFRLPGMVAIPSPESHSYPRLVGVDAAWPGRWSEQVELATRLRWTPMDAGAFMQDEMGRLVWSAAGDADSLQAGDVLQVSFGERTWLAPISSISIKEGKFHLSIPHTWELLQTHIYIPPALITSVALLSLKGPEELSVAVIDINGSLTFDLPMSIDLEGKDVGLLEPGDVLFLKREGFGWLAPISELSPVIRQESPPSSRVSIQCPHLLSTSLSVIPSMSPESMPDQVFRLRLDLIVREKGQNLPDLRNLAFNHGHSRFWGELAYLGTSPLQKITSTPEDGERARKAARFYHALREGERLDDEEKLIKDTTAFAALLAPLGPGEETQTYLPLGMLSIVGEGDYIRAHADAIGDDDLDIFDESQFFDRYLIGARESTSPGTLRSAVFDRLYIQKRRLKGLHSLFFLDEVALVSLPDVVQRAWNPAPPPTPEMITPSIPDHYVGDKFLECGLPPQVDHIQPPQGTTLGGAFVTISGCRFTSSEQTAVFFNGVPAGEVVVLDENTLSCITPPSVLLGPAVVTVSNWFGADSNDEIFNYEKPPLDRLPLLENVEAYDEAPLRRAQRHLLMFCQARGDVVAILSLPAHYLPQDCIAWQENLREDFRLPPWGYTQTTSLGLMDFSYAAVYHPWLMMVDKAASNGRFRMLPPDGAACGQIALRERLHQVWTAPANQPLKGILGVEKTFHPDDRLELFQRNFNLAVQEARQFLFLSAHTQSDRRQWKQLSVRRLMILLRKIAILRGMDYVFESNTERFRLGIQYALEELLLRMYERGAFAGRSPQQAFRISADSDVNPQQSVEQGRFVVQIQVAPSRPLEFLTVLLLRQGEGDIQAIETA